MFKYIKNMFKKKVIISYDIVEVTKPFEFYYIIRINYVDHDYEYVTEVAREGYYPEKWFTSKESATEYITQLKSKVTYDTVMTIKK